MIQMPVGFIYHTPTFYLLPAGQANLSCNDIFCRPIIKLFEYIIVKHSNTYQLF